MDPMKQPSQSVTGSSPSSFIIKKYVWVSVTEENPRPRTPENESA